jgi:CDP-6-deoxy-D-xylo-4-hexulose-3-dehydrase
MDPQSQYPRVPYGKSVHGEEEIAAVVRVLRTSTQMGPHVAEFERQVARLFSKQHGIMVNSGSSALYLAADLLDLPEGSEFITPVLTFATTVAPFVKKGLVPVFLDVEEGTYNLDVERIEGAISDHTKAIVVPNLIGNLPDWKTIREVARRRGLVVVEDSADTLGARLGEASTGIHSDLSTTSFYGSHVINCAGNGGMICVNDPEGARRALLLRSWGRSSSLFAHGEDPEARFAVDIDGTPYDGKFLFEEMGYNLEPSELGAAFGLVQLSKLEENIELRIEHFERQAEFFGSYEDWFILPRQLPDSYTGWLAFALTLRDSAPFSRTELQRFLESRNIQTRPVFTGNVLRQPGFRGIKHRVFGDLDNANRVTRGGILLACHHGLTSEMLDHLHASFGEFAARFR